MPRSPDVVRPEPLVLLVGIAIILTGFWAVPNPGQAEYEHDVTQVQSQDIPAERSPTPFDSLSPGAQTAFEKAVQADGQSTVYGARSRPREWNYGDAVGYYYVQYENEYYVVETSSDSFEIFDVGLFLLIATPGILLAGVGVRGWYRDDAQDRYWWILAGTALSIIGALLTFALFVL